jgi:hypothetical protein
MKTIRQNALRLVAGLALVSASAVAAFAADPPPSSPTPPPAPSAPTPPPAPPPADTQADTGDPNERICKKVQVPDSRLPTEMCMTRQEWKDAMKNPNE